MGIDATLAVTSVLGLVAVVFSYFAYRHTKERFRLDLFEKRWEVYKGVLEYCGAVTKYGGIPKAATNDERNNEIVDLILAAHESFRGIGYHKTRALFGPEIHARFDELNKSYAWLQAKPRTGDWPKKEHDHLTNTWEMIEELPRLFRPYMYFGDYKRPYFIQRLGEYIGGKIPNILKLNK